MMQIKDARIGQIVKCNGDGEIGWLAGLGWNGQEVVALCRFPIKTVPTVNEETERRIHFGNIEPVQ